LLLHSGRVAGAAQGLRGELGGRVGGGVLAGALDVVIQTLPGCGSRRRVQNGHDLAPLLLWLKNMRGGADNWVKGEGKKQALILLLSSQSAPIVTLKCPCLRPQRKKIAEMAEEQAEFKRKS